MLQHKVKKYDVPQKLQQQGLYPFFRSIQSQQDTVVKIDGKEVLMFGSNSYLGLTNHPQIMEAAKAAVDKYGVGCAEVQIEEAIEKSTRVAIGLKIIEPKQQTQKHFKTEVTL